MNWIAIFIGGGLGSILRYGFSVGAIKMGLTSFPYGTLLANIASCIVMVSALVLLLPKFNDDWVKPFLLIGFCGGFSTFSTFSFESFQLMKQGNWTLAGLNILVNILACLVVFFLASKKIEL